MNTVVIGNENITIVNSSNINLHIIQLLGTNDLPRYLTNTFSPIYFTGRIKELQAINKKLKSNSALLITNGIPGIGKTTLIQKYIVLNENTYDRIAWINCVTDIKTAIVNSTIRVALKFDFENKLSIEDRFTTIILALKNLNPKRGLLVIDNADDAKEITTHFKAGFFNLTNWSVIITSRTKPLIFSKELIFEVGLLSILQAERLFNKHYDKENNSQLVKKILLVVDRHTLTIEILAQNLNRLFSQGYKISNLYNDISTGVLNFPKCRPVQLQYNRTTKSIKLNSILPAIFNSIPIQTKLEKKVLLYLSILPSTEHSIEFLYQLFKVSVIKKENFEITIFSLFENGWINQNNKMHKLAQEVLRQRLKPTVKNCSELIQALNSKIELNENDGEHGIHKIPLLEVAEHVTKYVTGDSAGMAHLLKNLALVFEKIGEYDKCLEYNLIAENKFTQVFGNKHNEVAGIYANIGVVYRFLNNIEESLNYYKKAIRIRSKLLGADHLEMAVLYMNIAEVFRVQKRLSLSLKYHQHAYNIRKGKAPLFEISVCLNNMGLTYRDMGKYKKSIDTHLEDIELCKDKFEDLHPHYAIPFANLARVYFLNQEYDLAKKYITNSLAVFEKHFSATHPNLKRVTEWKNEIEAMVEKP